MPTQIQYALMAAASYISTRPFDVNKFPVPEGWTEYDQRGQRHSAFRAKPLTISRHPKRISAVVDGADAGRTQEMSRPVLQPAVRVKRSSR